jgi:hypothetical protein
MWLGGCAACTRSRDGASTSNQSAQSIPKQGAVCWPGSNTFARELCFFPTTICASQNRRQGRSCFTRSSRECTQPFPNPAPYSPLFNNGARRSESKRIRSTRSHLLGLKLDRNVGHISAFYSVSTVTRSSIGCPPSEWPCRVLATLCHSASWVPRRARYGSKI